MARMTRLSTEDLIQEARSRATYSQRIVLDRVLAAGWKISKVDGYVGKDCVICLWLNGNGMAIDPLGLIERTRPGAKTLRYRLPTSKTRTDYAPASANLSQ